MYSALKTISAYHAAAFFAVVLCAYIVLRKRHIQRLINPRGLPYPPGPKPRPIIGNMLDLAAENEAIVYQRLAEKYGDVVFLSAFGRHVLFINSFDTANELFDKRSAIYSDRPQSTMSHELMGWTFSFGHMRYGNRWKKHRRMFYSQFQPSVAPKYWAIQTKEAHALLRRLLHSSENLDYQLRHNAAAVIMNITYGITIADKEDRYIEMAEKALEGMGQAASPGAFLVDLLPCLKYVPEWIPGASFKRKAREWGEALKQMKDAPFNTVVHEMKKGITRPSFVSALLRELEAKENVEEEVETIKNCAGLTYAAGAESTVYSLSSFILAVLTHPEVQFKAQEELDRVIGRERLPELSDRSELPYINAVLKEVLRWSPVAPLVFYDLGLPHMTTRDDEFNEYFIPAGTIVVGNSLRILHDPKTYPDPTRFNPDRFLGEGDKGEWQHFLPVDPLSTAFGYGRRVCPGRYMAEAQVWISIACILSVFNVQPALDGYGRPVEVEPAFSSKGMIRHPLPFKYSMQPRNGLSRSLIEQTEDIP